MEIIRCKDIYKTYPGSEKAVLNGVSLSLDEGCFVSIMGRSGSGKSTLLKILCGLLKPDSGFVTVAGVCPHRIFGKEQTVFRSEKIGIVFQESLLISDLTILDNILSPLYIAGKKPDKEYLNRLLELTELKDHQKKFPSQLSGGQRQRAAVARAVISRPAVLFADEPTGSLDSVSEKSVMALFCSLNRDFHTAIVQVTHSKFCAESGGSIITINDGKVGESV